MGKGGGGPPSPPPPPPSPPIRNLQEVNARAAQAVSHGKIRDLINYMSRAVECEEEEAPNYTLGFVLTFVAGSATTLGSLAICFVKDSENPKKMTAAALGFAAGVMTYVSFVDVLGAESPEFFGSHFAPEGCERRKMQEAFGPEPGNAGPVVEEGETIWVRVCVAGFFFLGIILAMGLDVCVDCLFSGGHGHGHGGHDHSHDEEAKGDTVTPDKEEENTSLQRISMVTFFALAMHNFPEGIATFFGGGTGSFTVPIAIAMHNIPEGMAIAIPCYQVTGSFCTAVRNTFIAGLAQPIGAAFGWFLIVQLQIEDLPAFTYGAVYSLTAGVMVCVSIMELLPEAFASAPANYVIWFVFAGFVMMEFSIICLDLAGV